MILGMAVVLCGIPIQRRDGHHHLDAHVEIIGWWLALWELPIGPVEQFMCVHRDQTLAHCPVKCAQTLVHFVLLIRNLLI